MKDDKDLRKGPDIKKPEEQREEFPVPGEKQPKEKSPGRLETQTPEKASEKDPLTPEKSPDPELMR